MATIRSALVLNDGMSSVLRKINKAMGTVLDSFDAVQRASGQTFNTANIYDARRAIGEANAMLDEMEKSYSNLNTQQTRLNRNINEGTTAASGLLDKVKGIAAAYISMKTVKGLVELSDGIVQTKARLGMMNDGLQTTDALMGMIFRSAERARGSYTDMAAAVAKLGNNAGAAFGSTAEIVKFTELVQKQFTIAGASGTEASNAMLQLTQALSSGVLRGDELNSIFEQAPNLIQTVADYMGVGIGQIRSMAAEGQITADIVKNAMFASADAIDEKFNNMPRTWSQVWTSMKNQAITILEPVLSKINQLANSERVQRAVNGILNLLKMLVHALSSVYNSVSANWGKLKYIIYGIVTAFLAYNAALLVHKVKLLGAAAASKVKAAADYRTAKATLAAAKAAGVNTGTLTGEALAAAAAAAGLDGEAVATAQATVAQTGFNTALLSNPLMWFAAALLVVAVVLKMVGVALEWIIVIIAALVVAYAAWQIAQWALNGAMYACPIVWILALVIALIVILFVLFKMFTQEIMGAIFWLGALFKNVGLWIANLAIAIWNSIKNVGLWFANLGLAIWQVIKNIGAWFANLGASVWAIIKNTGLWFANLGMGIWNVLKAAASNVGTAFHNAWISVQIGFWSMVNVIMQGLKKLAEFANSVLGWMGVNIDTSGLDFAANKIDELASKKDSYESVADAWAEGFNTFAYDSVSDAWNSHEYGSVSDAFNTNDIDWAGGWNEGMNTFDTFQEGWGTDAYNAGAAVGADIQDWMDENLSLNGIMNGLGLGDLMGGDSIDPMGYGDTLDGIADDTGSIADATGKSSEELSYLRDIAEKEAVNRFTTAEIRVDMSGMTNRIDSDMDIDGVIGYLTEELTEAMLTAAEGVY